MMKCKHMGGEQQRVVQLLQSQETVALIGDGRCDSPGWCAKYCTYSLMHAETELTAGFELIQVTEPGSSVRMECVGSEKSQVPAWFWSGRHKCSLRWCVAWWKDICRRSRTQLRCIPHGKHSEKRRDGKITDTWRQGFRGMASFNTIPTMVEFLVILTCWWKSGNPSCTTPATSTSGQMTLNTRWSTSVTMHH